MLVYTRRIKRQSLTTGETTITATVADGKNYAYNSKTATYTLTVN